MENRLQNRTLLVLKYLWEQSDEQNPVSAANITEYLSDNGIEVKDIRTISRDIMDLMDLGIDIIEQRKERKWYFIGSRHFEAPEIKLLVDAVQSSRFITAKKSRALIDKLAVFAAPPQSDILNRQLYVDRRAKADNESIYITVDQIQTAIAQGRMIAFRYYEYLPSKEKQLKHDGLVYELSPYAMLWNNDSYYVAGYSARHSKIVKYRIDRIDRLNILDTQQTPMPEDFDVSEFFSQEFSMLDGEECEVELLCENALMNSIIDRFGEDVKTQVVDSEHFAVKVTVDLSGTFYGWVFASAGRMRIKGPETVVKGFQNMLESFQS